MATPDDGRAGLLPGGALPADQSDGTAADRRVAGRRHHDDRGPIRQRAEPPPAADHDGAAARARRAVHHRRHAARAAPMASDVVFVAVVFAAVYVRRFGARGRALGMVAFMSYFFTLYLRASLSELPWMILADRGGNGVHVRDGHLRAARSARTRAARHYSGAARADGHRDRHHRRSGPHRPARRTATSPHAGPHHPAQRDRPDGAGPDRGQSQPRHASTAG